MIRSAEPSYCICHPTVLTLIPSRRSGLNSRHTSASSNCAQLTLFAPLFQPLLHSLPALTLAAGSLLLDTADVFTCCSSMLSRGSGILWSRVSMLALTVGSLRTPSASKARLAGSCGAELLLNQVSITILIFTFLDLTGSFCPVADHSALWPPFSCAGNAYP